MSREGHHPRHDGRLLRRQEQLVGRLRALGLLAVRPRGRAPARRRPRQVDRRGPAADHRRRPRRDADRLPGRRARRRARSAPSRTTCSRTSARPADRRALARRVHRRAARTCPTTRRRARCAAATSRRRRACRGRGPPPRTARSEPRDELEAIYLGEAGPHARTTTSSPTAASASARATPGSCSRTCSASPNVRNYDGSWTEWGNARARADREARDRGLRADPELQEIVDDFADSPTGSCGSSCCSTTRTSCRRCPSATPSDHDRLERVHECQTPLFLAVEVGRTRRVHLFFDAPPEAPTTRGFAGILAAGLDGRDRRARCSRRRRTSTPRWGSAELVSPLRLRGMSAMLAAIKRRVAQQAS